MTRQLQRRVATLSIAVVASLQTFAAPAYAKNGSSDGTTVSGVECSVPTDFVPLFDLLDALTQLAFLGGVGVGTLGFMVAGIMIAAPGEDWTRWGKTVAKHVVAGVILLLSANMIMSFLTSQLGGVFC